MLGQKLSIVTRKAQTTRHKLLGILSEPDYQMILFDTPGIIQVSHPMLLIVSETLIQDILLDALHDLSRPVDSCEGAECMRMRAPEL